MISLVGYHYHSFHYNGIHLISGPLEFAIKKKHSFNMHFSRDKTKKTKKTTIKKKKTWKIQFMRLSKWINWFITFHLIATLGQVSLSLNINRSNNSHTSRVSSLKTYITSGHDKMMWTERKKNHFGATFLIVKFTGEECLSLWWYNLPN